MTTPQVLFLGGVAVLIVGLWLYWNRKRHRDLSAVAAPFPAGWRELLTQRVAFYRALSKPEQGRFEQRMLLFLGRTRITGIETEVDALTQVLVAASAVIPIWGFPDWEYPNLREVLIVPDAWREKANHEREFTGLQGTLLGSVQEFQADQYMRLSKSALERGFRDWQNGENVGLHEFAHVLDHSDGRINGAPALALSPDLQTAWADVVQHELARVRRGSGILNPYAGTSEAELFAVAVESFFEEPHRLAEHHPDLYALLSKALGQQPTQRFERLNLGRLLRRGGGGRGAERRG